MGGGVYPSWLTYRYKQKAHYGGGQLTAKVFCSTSKRTVVRVNQWDVGFINHLSYAWFPLASVHNQSTTSATTADGWSFFRLSILPHLLLLAVISQVLRQLTPQRFRLLTVSSIRRRRRYILMPYITSLIGHSSSVSFLFKYLSRAVIDRISDNVFRGNSVPRSLSVA